MEIDRGSWVLEHKYSSSNACGEHNSTKFMSFICRFEEAKIDLKFNGCDHYQCLSLLIMVDI